MTAPLCVLLLLVVVVAATGWSCQEARPLVAIKEGVVRGLALRSAGGAVFYSFKGIRYAKPPVGALRFQPPQRPPGWPGVFDARDHGSHCLQFNVHKDGGKDGSEDCLFANVHTPLLPSPNGAAGLPVMVFIHGGAFRSGSGDDGGPGYFMDGRVVLVTFNYRLGPFGFFTTESEAAPGNYGVLDQVMMLQWVRDNVAAFGGEPDAVTIFGHSAGAVSVSLLVLSPMAKGLFHHAISQSGSSVKNLARIDGTKGFAKTYAKQLNCSSDDAAAMVECLRAISADEMLEALKALNPFAIHFFPRTDYESASPFLPGDPRTILANGTFNLVPWMNGFTEEEGADIVFFFSDPRQVQTVLAGNLTHWGATLQLTSESDSSIADCAVEAMQEVSRLFDFYVGDGSLSANNPLPLVRAIGDSAFVVPISEEIRLASAHAPVYKFIIDHRGPGRLAFSDLIQTGSIFPDLGPSHADSLMYLFSNMILPTPPPDSPAYTMIRFMVDVWTTFARTGRPSSRVLPMPDWPIFTESTQRHMRLNSQPSVGACAFEERLAFWRTLRINEQCSNVV